MFAKLLAQFRRPSLAQVEAQELEDAQHALLRAENHQEFFAMEVEMLKKRIARLEARRRVDQGVTQKVSALR